MHGETSTIETLHVPPIQLFKLPFIDELDLYYAVISAFKNKNKISITYCLIYIYIYIYIYISKQQKLNDIKQSLSDQLQTPKQKNEKRVQPM